MGKLNYAGEVHKSVPTHNYTLCSLILIIRWHGYPTVITTRTKNRENFQTASCFNNLCNQKNSLKLCITTRESNSRSNLDRQPYTLTAKPTRLCIFYVHSSDTQCDFVLMPGQVRSIAIMLAVINTHIFCGL